jgi:hypothetical protein
MNTTAHRSVGKYDEGAQMRSWSETDAWDRLTSLTVGHTTLVNGHPVTRWSFDHFEVGTWGRSVMTLSLAVKEVLK